MKAVLRGRNLEDIIPLLDASQIKVVDTEPDIVIAYGGDGTLLGAEAEFPGIPKLAMRDIENAQLCEKHSQLNQIDEYVSGKLIKTDLVKLSGTFRNSEILGMNDVFVYNKKRVSAIRFRIWIDDELYGEEIVGDAFGVSTPHGSTALYRSLTHSVFRIGIGLSFSHTIQPVNHLVLSENAIIKAQITRGPAIMVADNSHEEISLKEGDIITFKKAEELVTVHGLKFFMCPECRNLRHKHRKMVGF